MQAIQSEIDVLPDLGFAVPAAHKVHEDDPGAAHCPGIQIWHVPLELEDPVPPGQLTQTEDPIPDPVPLGQVRQSAEDVLPVNELYVPTGH